MDTIYIFTKNDQKRLIPENYEVVFFKSNKDLKDINPDDIFISYEHASPLEFRLQFYAIPVSNLAISTQELDIDKLLQDEESNYIQDYKIFSGSKINVTNPKNREIIEQNIRFLSNIMYQMLEAGYHEDETNQKIDDWILTFEDPLLKLFKIYHRIETSNPSVDIEEEFLINPQFRKMITFMFMKIIANFICNNNLIKVEEVAKIGDWSSTKTWEELRKKISILKKNEK